MNYQPFLELFTGLDLFSTAKHAKRFESTWACEFFRRDRVGPNTVMVHRACWILSKSGVHFPSETCPRIQMDVRKIVIFRILNTLLQVSSDRRIAHFHVAIFDERQKATTWNAYVNASVDVIFHAHVVALPPQNMSARRKTTTASLTIFVVF